MDAERPRASYASQANAMMRKNLVLQRRRYRQTLRLVLFPALLCLGLFGLQLAVNKLLDTSAYTCGCRCVPISNSTGGCEKRCGVEYSDDTQALSCEVATPPQLPAFMQVPDPAFRAVDLDGQFPGFPDPACRASGTCPLIFLYTGENRSVADALVGNMLGKDLLSDPQNPFSTLVPGTSKDVPQSLYLEPALPNSSVLLQADCNTLAFQGAPCTPTAMVWLGSKSTIDDHIYRGYSNGDRNTHINGVPVAYDFQATNTKKLEATIFFNVSFRGMVMQQNDSPVLRVARSMNLASKAFLKMVATSAAELPFSFLKDVPKPKAKILLDFSTLLGPLAYSFIIQLLFPVILTSLVHEKQHNLRMMMKMHGLSDAPYYFISYLYFLAFSTLYIFCFVLFASLVGLDYFRRNSYILQLIFYMVFLNLQIALAFFSASIISHVTTATVFGYLYIFIMALAGRIFDNLYEDPDFSRAAIIALELIPGFSLHRGLYEFREYTLVGANSGTRTGMKWHNLNDSENGLLGVIGIMAAEWPVFMLLAIYLDQVVRSGSGVKKHPLFFLESCFRKSTRPVAAPSDPEGESPRDVVHERAVVERLQEAHDPAYAIICDDLKKVYPGQDGNENKYAVRRLSLAIKSGECFGLLGPNGAGKTTSIKMMIGFLAPSSGKATVGGLDISEDMEKIYAIMGVCPQDDLLWETLTGREHLMFYGRLKNLKGPALENAVQASLRAVNLLDAANKQAGKYSGGMKRRLSVAISLIGNPKAVYMDEPSTGLDPASRRRLWSAIRRAKRNCAIILTTHSMEEAEALCDRVGIFVKGELQCIGSSKELKSRYAGSYIFTVTSEASKAAEVESMVHSWSASANRVYSLSGTQKFELPKAEVPVSKVFKDVGSAKSKLGIHAWGLTETMLESVFIKVAS